MQKASDEVVAGAWAGLVGTVLGYPLDVVKSRMQTGFTGGGGGGGGGGGIGGAMQGMRGSSMGSTHPGRATFIRTFTHLVKTEGPVGMYKGLGPPVCMMMLMNSVNFTAFNRLQEDVVGIEPVGWGTNNQKINWKVVACGAAVGPLCAAIGTPFELIKLQLQLDGVNTAQKESNGNPLKAHPKHSKRAYRGALDAARKLYQQYGVRVFYLGGCTNIAREMLFNAIFFGTYEHVQWGCRREAANLNLIPSTAVAVAGGLAGAAAWFGNLPLDCIKSGIQGQDLRNGGWCRVKKTGKIGFVESSKEVLKTRGVFGFYSGAAPSIVRSFIVSGSRFVAFAGAIKVIEENRERDET